jgi:hypothetical protein
MISRETSCGRPPEGRLTDIMPRRDGLTRLLFLPGSRRGARDETSPARAAAG